MERRGASAEPGKCAAPPPRARLTLARPWANIYAGKSSNEIGMCDSHGCGKYTSQRNHSPQSSEEILHSDGSVVSAPFTGKIVDQEKPYKHKNAINNGVQIT
ncbi:leukocyte cell-derived chemotaxin-2 [Sorex araneus]|uniref:leukocyte cell-derived chemotaxin-2 n=1 Tax=Sorex araneus TaxID=42254 RepID=UPI002433FD24|nr:leukocyte cell-derived chemotaxin-2 [Sorex araneus]